MDDEGATRQGTGYLTEPRLIRKVETKDLTKDSGGQGQEVLFRLLQEAPPSQDQLLVPTLPGHPQLREAIFPPLDLPLKVQRRDPTELSHCDRALPLRHGRMGGGELQHRLLVQVLCCVLFCFLFSLNLFFFVL